MNHPGRTIRKLLDEQLRTQTELSKQMGITQPHLSDIITGKRGVTARTAVKLSKALGLEPEE